MQIPVNFFSVLLASIASMVVGFLWYSPLLVGNIWMKEMGITSKSMEKAKKNMGLLYGLSWVGSLVMAYVLTHVTVMSMNFFQYPRLSSAVTSAFWMWFGFIAPVQMTEVIFGGKSWKLYALNTGYQFFSMLSMGLVIGWF
jgi:hypothetical protein